MRKKVKSGLPSPILWLVVYTCTYFIYNDFGIRLFFSAIVCVILFAMSLARQMSGHSLRIRKDPIKAAFLCIAAVMLLIFLRPSSEHDRVNILFVGTIGFCALMLLISDPERESAESSLKILMAVSVAIAVITAFFTLNKGLYRAVIYPLLGEKFQSYYDLTSVRGYGVSIGGVTYTAYFLALGLAILYGRVVSQKSLSWKTTLLGICLGALFLGAMFLLGRKGELVSVAAALLVMWGIGLLLRKGHIEKRSLISAAVILLVLVLVLILFAPSLLNADYFQRYLTMIYNLVNGRDVTSGRVQLWKWGWELFTEHPLFGGGLGSYNRFIPESARITGAGTVIQGPHIVYLHFLCEFGIVGFILLMAPLVYIFVKTLRQYLRLAALRIGRKNTEGEALTVCANTVSLFMQIFFAFLFFFDQTFNLNHFWLFYCITLYFSSVALSFEGGLSGPPVQSSRESK